MSDRSDTPAPTSREAWDWCEPKWLIDKDDVNRFRRWAFDNHYGDSAYAFRRLLEKAGVE